MIITIAGKPGSGKSTIAKMISEKLNLRHYSVGDFRRKLAEKRGITLEELNNEDEEKQETDKLADEWQKELAKTEDNFVIDGRLSSYFIPNSIKIFLDVKPEVGARRVLEHRKNSKVESYENAEEAIKKLKEREQSDARRYKELYNIEYDKISYDLIIDTTNENVNSITKKLLEFIRNS